MTRRILILIGGHLATGPRPQKEVAAARAAGLDVSVRGVWWDDALAAEDVKLAEELGVDLCPVADFRPSAAGRNRLRLLQRCSRELYLRLGLTTGRIFGLGGPEMLREAFRNKADLTMVHSEAGLWVAKHLLASGLKVGVDFEDWFSQDLPPDDRKGRPVRQIRSLERHLLQRASLTLTTTRAMASAMADDAGTEREPLVIPNCFPGIKKVNRSEIVRDRLDRDAISFYWYSQTIGPGRGLETLAKALPLLRGNWELHLRGNLRGYDVWFDEHFSAPIRSRIHLHPCVSNEDLPYYSADHDVGLALEIPYCLNKDLTASNKIFDYLRCGLAVIASNTRGQVEVMEPCPGAGVVVPADDPPSLTAAMQHYLDSPSALLEARICSARAAKENWPWERFSDRLGEKLHSTIFLSR